MSDYAPVLLLSSSPSDHNRVDDTPVEINPKPPLLIAQESGNADNTAVSPGARTVSEALSSYSNPSHWQVNGNTIRIDQNDLVPNAQQSLQYLINKFEQTPQSQGVVERMMNAALGLSNEQRGIQAVFSVMDAELDAKQTFTLDDAARMQVVIANQPKTIWHDAGHFIADSYGVNQAEELEGKFYTDDVVSFLNQALSSQKLSTSTTVPVSEQYGVKQFAARVKANYPSETLLVNGYSFLMSASFRENISFTNAESALVAVQSAEQLLRDNGQLALSADQDPPIVQELLYSESRSDSLLNIAKRIRSDSTQPSGLSEWFMTLSQVLTDQVVAQGVGKEGFLDRAAAISAARFLVWKAGYNKNSLPLHVDMAQLRTSYADAANVDLRKELPPMHQQFRTAFGLSAVQTSQTDFSSSPAQGAQPVPILGAKSSGAVETTADQNPASFQLFGTAKITAGQQTHDGEVSWHSGVIDGNGEPLAYGEELSNAMIQVLHTNSGSETVVLSAHDLLHHVPTGTGVDMRAGPGGNTTNSVLDEAINSSLNAAVNGWRQSRGIDVNTAVTTPPAVATGRRIFDHADLTSAITQDGQVSAGGVIRKTDDMGGYAFLEGAYRITPVNEEMTSVTSTGVVEKALQQSISDLLASDPTIAEELNANQMTMAAQLSQALELQRGGPEQPDQETTHVGVYLTPHTSRALMTAYRGAFEKVLGLDSVKGTPSAAVIQEQVDYYNYFLNGSFVEQPATQSADMSASRPVSPVSEGENTQDINKINFVSGHEPFAIDGHELTPSDIIRLSGAPEGSTVTTHTHPVRGGVEVLIEHPELLDADAKTNLIIQETGDGLHQLRWYGLYKNESAPPGVGRNIVSRSISAATDLGFDRIVANAQGGYGMPLSGYRFWPGMGFDLPLPQWFKDQLQTPLSVEAMQQLGVEESVLPESLQSANTIQELISTSLGKQYWRFNGFVGDVVLNLNNNSISQNATSSRQSNPLRNDLPFNDTSSQGGNQSPQGVLRPGGDTSGTSFSTTPFGTLNPAGLNPNGVVGNNGSQAGQDGNGGRGNAPTAVAAPGENNPFSNSIPEAGAVLPQTPNVLIPGGWQMPAPGELLNGIFIPDTAPAPESANPSSEPAQGPSISYTPESDSGGVTIGGQLGSPGEAEKANTEMEQLLGKGWRQGLRPDLPPTNIDSRIPGFGEGVPPADVGSNDTRWGLPDEPVTLPESEGFPEKDPVLDNILNPNGVGRPQFTFPPINEGSRIPEVPAEAQAAFTKALPELKGIRYAQFSQLSAADQQQIIPRTLAYQQLAPNDKTNISLIEYLDSSKTSEPQREQLSGLDAAQTADRAKLDSIAARVGLTNGTIELIDARINGLQATTAQINQQTQSIQQSNAERLSTLTTQAQADPMGAAFIAPETLQSTPESDPQIKAPISENNAPIPKFMVVRTENGPQLMENLANGQNQLHAYPLPADTPITRQESNGAWSGVPDVGQIGSKLFLDLLFTNGALKMLNNGNPVQAPRGTPQQPPVNGTPQAPTAVPQPGF